MKKLVIVFIVAISLSTSFSKTSYAFNYGDNPKWYDPNFNLNYRDLIHPKYTTEYRASFAVAVTNWDNATNSISFSYILDKYYYISDTRVKGSRLGNVGYNAVVHHYHASNYDSITANYTAMDSMDIYKKSGVFAHELGHVFGLDHTKDPYTVMCTSRDGRKVYIPSADDVAGVNFLY